MAAVAALKVEVKVTFTLRASALLRDLLTAIREGNPWQYQDLLERLERLEPLLKVVD